MWVKKSQGGAEGAHRRVITRNTTHILPSLGDALAFAPGMGLRNLGGGRFRPGTASKFRGGACVRRAGGEARRWVFGALRVVV